MPRTPPTSRHRSFNIQALGLRQFRLTEGSAIAVRPRLRWLALTVRNIVRTRSWRVGKASLYSITTIDITKVTVSITRGIQGVEDRNRREVPRGRSPGPCAITVPRGWPSMCREHRRDRTGHVDHVRRWWSPVGLGSCSCRTLSHTRRGRRGCRSSPAKRGDHARWHVRTLTTFNM